MGYKKIARGWHAYSSPYINELLSCTMLFNVMWFIGSYYCLTNVLCKPAFTSVCGLNFTLTKPSCQTKRERV